MIFPRTFDEGASHTVASGGRVSRRPDDLRFSPEEVLDRVDRQGDLAADLFIDDPAAVPTETDSD